MGKARHTRQGIMIRFDENDAGLVEWLGQFAQSQTMTRVVKLACYTMAGLPVPESLQAVAPSVDQTRHEPQAAPPFTRPTANEQTGDALAEVMQELVALREAVTGQQAPRDLSPNRSSAEGPISLTRGGSRRGWRQPAYEAQPPWNDVPAENAPPEERSSGQGAASGLGFGRARPRTKPMRADPSVSPPLPFFDAQSAQEQLLMSIRGYGKKRT